MRKLGDPDKDQQYLRATSPLYHIDAIKIPILLIHGDEDEIVPYEQSEIMQKALTKAGKQSQLLKLENEGHGGFCKQHSLVMLSTIGTFLWDHLGKGFGVDSPPPKYKFVK